MSPQEGYSDKTISSVSVFFIKIFFLMSPQEGYCDKTISNVSGDLELKYQTMFKARLVKGPGQVKVYFFHQNIFLNVPPRGV